MTKWILAVSIYTAVNCVAVPAFCMSGVDDLEKGIENTVQQPIVGPSQQIQPEHWSYKLVQKLRQQTGLDQKSTSLALDGEKPLSRTEMAIALVDLAAVLPQEAAIKILDVREQTHFEILQEEFQSEMQVLRARIEKVETTVDHLLAQVEKSLKNQEEEKTHAVQVSKGSIKLFGQFHAWNTTAFDDTLTDRNFRLRRANIGVEGKINEDWQYKVMFDSTRRDRILKDLTLEYTGLPHHTVRIGQFKPGLTYDSLRSSSKNFTSERSQIGALTNMREQGLAILGDWKAINYMMGVYNGESENSTDQNRHLSFGGRVAYKPLTYLLDEKKWGLLELGGSMFKGKTGIPDAAYSNKDRYGFTAHYAHRKFELTSEYLKFDDADVQGKGYYVEGVYRVTPKWDLVARYDTLDPNKLINDTRKQYIVGVNHYIEKYNVRLALEYLKFTDPLKINDGQAIRMLVQHTF
jgi:phosphate-selective porin